VLLDSAYDQRNSSRIRLTQSLGTVIQIFNVLQNPQILYGATLAQQHVEPLLPEFSSPGTDSIVFLLDLSGTMSVAASYIRATLHWTFLCGQADARENRLAGGLEKWAVRALPLFPAVKGGSPEVIADVDDFFRHRGLPLLLVTKRTTSRIKAARLLGTLDGFLQTTLQLLIAKGEATAMQLAEQSSEKITVNGWSNRLADLYLLRLVIRKRSGKFWIYSPLTESLSSWA
jgi:hypothetical protein